MKRNCMRILSLLLVVVTILSVFGITASALSWDGSSNGGGGGGTVAGPNGYAVRTTGDNCIGYRFSVVNKSGGNKVAKVIDVFRNTIYGNSQYFAGYKFNTKYNKKQLKDNQNSGFSTSKTSTNCYKESSMGFATGLPQPSGMSSWQANNTNLNAVLSTLGAGSISALKNGDKVLVEPIYDVRLQSIHHALTVTEIALYGKYILGVNSDGGSSSTSASWGFISSYTNKHYPNALFTPDGQGLWTSASALSKRATFYTMINTGYGVGIAYTETKPDFSPNLTVKKCEAWPGKISTRNSNHYGISTGSTFANYEYGHGYPKSGDKVWFALNFPAESENCYVKQSVWIDGGGSTSRNVWSNSNTWYDVQLSPDTVDDNRSGYVVKARVDWIDGNGNVRKWGSEKTFYIPVKPILTRLKVSASNIIGEVQACDSVNGASGAVYVGQRITQKYHFKVQNKWTSYHYLRGQTYIWNMKNDWVIQYNNASLGNADLYDDKVAINSSSEYSSNSRLGQYRVPDNSANTNGENRIPVYTWTHWYSDIDNTTETKWFNIPVVKADAEITDIVLADANGNILNHRSLEVNDTVYVYHRYYNNTKCKIFVEGYKDDNSKISGIYAIEPYLDILVPAGSFVVPNKRDFSLWGGVYLEGAGRGYTAWETNGDNNSMILLCKSNHPVSIVPLAPNASYREQTNVISSFRIYNRASDDYIPSNNLKVKFTVNKIDGTQIYTETRNVIVPAKNNNLVYFSWRVPYGMNYQNVVVKAEIQDGNKSYNLVSNNRSTIPRLSYSVPDTQFEKEAPNGFTAPAKPSTQTSYTTWYEYAYENNQFVNKKYGIGIYTGGTHTITPATGETAVKENGKWTMKSGYGLSLISISCMQAVSGTESPEYGKGYTVPQYAYALFPEYGYAFGEGKCETLDNTRYNGYSARIFKNKMKYGNVHFTPLWYPDGEYAIRVMESDAWTPMGMLTCSIVPNTVTIKGNAYDDWYIGAPN